MSRYALTSEKFEGEVLIGYEEGVLASLDASQSTMNKEMLHYLWGTPPSFFLEKDINKATGNSPHAKVIRLEDKPPAFADFWAKYFAGRQKDNSSKKKAEIKWNRMSGAQQSAAFKYIGRYMANVSFGTVPKLAETYLGSEVWG
jgi:hypothetical protein